MPISATEILIWILLGYLVASLSTAVIVCRILGVADPRSAGSHNAGATNVLRLAGKLAGVLTLAGDILKGVLPTWLANELHRPDLLIGLVGLTAVVGHIFPVYHGFRGGKGVATGLGVLGIWYWPAALAFVAGWIPAMALGRISSLASLSGLAAATAFTWWQAPAWGWPVTALALLITGRHHHNLRNLAAGLEPRFRR